MLPGLHVHACRLPLNSSADVDAEDVVSVASPSASCGIKEKGSIGLEDALVALLGPIDDVAVDEDVAVVIPTGGTGAAMGCALGCQAGVCVDPTGNSNSIGLLGCGAVITLVAGSVLANTTGLSRSSEQLVFW